MERSKFTHINRVIDPKTRIHYLDAIDEHGRHWTAQMSPHIEEWLCYIRPWRLTGHNGDGLLPYN